MLSAVEQELRGRISGARAVAHVEKLVTVGDRFVGAQGDRLAAQAVRDRFAELGLEVVDRPFTTLGYGHESASLTLLGTGTRLDAIPPYFSPATAAGGVTGELVFVGGGEAADYEGLDVRGKIVVMQEVGLGYSRFWLGTFAAEAARRGAVGMVVIHPLPWPYRMSMEAGNGELSRRFLDEQLPVVCISAIDGAILMHAIGSGNAGAELAVVSEMGDVESSNVSGVLRGSEWPGEAIVVLAHRDHGLYPGANDNGSGFGTMLEIAGAMAAMRPRRSIEFLCTTAEEGTTPGVAAYIESRRAEGSLGDVRAAVDLDMFGVGGKLKLVELGLWPDTDPIPHTEWLMGLLEDVADGLGYEVGRMTAPWGVAESGRFIQAGVPAAWFWKPDDFYYHSNYDTVDNLDGNSLKAVADITAIALWRMAEDGALPREV
ncbi:MAG: M20/M25/M40 family metallo-hydrolase [Gaiellales bacterium]